MLHSIVVYCTISYRTIYCSVCSMQHYNPLYCIFLHFHCIILYIVLFFVLYELCSLILNYCITFIFFCLSIFRLVFVDTSMIHVFSRSYDSTALLHQFLMMMAMILA